MGSDGCPIKKNHVEILRGLSCLPKKERQILLRYIDSKLIKCICECAYNVLRGNVPLDSEQKTRLRKHATVLRQLVRRGDTLKKKKKIVQTGGGAFLPSLLVPVLAAVLTEILR